MTTITREEGLAAIAAWWAHHQDRREDDEIVLGGATVNKVTANHMNAAFGSTIGSTPEMVLQDALGVAWTELRAASDAKVESNSRLDDAYTQRNTLAIAFADLAVKLGWKAGWGRDNDEHKGHDEEWRTVVYVEMPYGRQLSWHMSPGEQMWAKQILPAFDGEWDGSFTGRDAPEWLSLLPAFAVDRVTDALPSRLFSNDAVHITTTITGTEYLKTLGSMLDAPVAAPSASAPIETSRIGSYLADHGGIYSGLIRGLDGAPDAHLVLLEAAASNVTWGQAAKWAESVGGALPSRREQQMLFINLKDQFEQNWHWSSETCFQVPNCAWVRYFSDGGELAPHKTIKGRARAVRRVPVQAFAHEVAEELLARRPAAPVLAQTGIPVPATSSQGAIDGRIHKRGLDEQVMSELRDRAEKAEAALAEATHGLKVAEDQLGGEIKRLRNVLAVESAALTDAVRHIGNLKERALLAGRGAAAEKAGGLLHIGYINSVHVDQMPLLKGERFGACPAIMPCESDVGDKAVKVFAYVDSPTAADVVVQAAACWSCERQYTANQRTEADGNCPHCGVEIELDDNDYARAAIAARGEITGDEQ